MRISENSRPEYNTPIFPFKWQVLVSAVFSGGFSLILILTTNADYGYLFQNFLANFLLMILISQGAVFISRQSEGYFSWFTHPGRRILFYLIPGYLYCSLVDRITIEMLNFVSGGPARTAYDIGISSFISFLLFSLMVTGYNVVLFIRAFKEKQADERANQFGNYFEQLINNIEDMISVISADEKILYHSSGILIHTGYTAAEMKTLGFLDIVHPDDRERVRNEFRRFISNPENYLYSRYRVVAKNGMVRHFEAKISNGLDIPLVNGYIATLREISGRHYFEKYIVRQTELYRLLTDISKSFLAVSYPDALKEMLDRIGRFAEVERAYAYRLDEVGQMWVCLHEWRSAEGEKVPSLYYETGFSAEDAAWMLKEFNKDRIIRFERLEDMPREAAREREMFEADGTVSILLMPMKVNGKVIGFIGFDSLFEPKHWDDDDLLVLNICTEVVTSSLKRFETEQSVKESLSINSVIIESTSDGILLANKNGEVIYCNDNLMRIWQLKDNPVGVNVFSVIAHAIRLVRDSTVIDDVIEHVRNDPAARISLEVRLINNTVLEILSAAQVLDGKVAGRIWSCRDITDRTNSERERIEKGVAQAQFESLRNQLNPHFLFNSLNVLSSLVHIDADLSEQFIDQLARSYRYLLEQKGKELVPLKVEIDFIHSFVFLLKIRFENKLQVNVNVYQGSMDQLVAPLTLQLLIENAVKHNIVSADEPLVIDIHDHEPGYLIVRNNLQLRINRMPSTGLGLKNIVSRYALLTDRVPEFKAENGQYIAVIPLIN